MAVSKVQANETDGDALVTDHIIMQGDPTASLRPARREMLGCCAVPGAAPDWPACGISSSARFQTTPAPPGPSHRRIHRCKTAIQRPQRFFCEYVWTG